MDEIFYGRLAKRHLFELREFCAANWGSEHPLIHNEKMFDWYYGGNDINMVIAYTKTSDSISIQGVCGYILTNSSSSPDVFLSYILSKKGIKFGVSLRLIEYIKSITNARTINCNNIRRETRGIYEFLNYTVADMQHYYRLNPSIKEYSLSCVKAYEEKEVLSKKTEFCRISTASDLDDFNFSEYIDNKPYKDKAYLLRRYLNYPFHEYMVYSMTLKDERALLVLRRIEYESAVMLRVVDFIGERNLIKESGYLLDRLMKENGAEFIDWYSYGVSEEEMIRAGFSLCKEDKDDIVPFYLSPPVMENVKITVFVSDSEDFMMFRADGDQDRPNLG